MKMFLDIGSDPDVELHYRDAHVSITNRMNLRREPKANEKISAIAAFYLRPIDDQKRLLAMDVAYPPFKELLVQASLKPKE